MEKLKRLQKLLNLIDNCQICQKDSLGKLVFGEGDPDAKIMFVGEAPGKQEAESGRPFIGRSGKLLRGLINGAGLKDEEVYITSPVKFLPKRGTPTKSQIDHSREHFSEQINIIEPKILVLLGATAIAAVLEIKIPIKIEHGKVIEKDGKTYFLTLHPAAGLRFPPLKKLLEEDFLKLKTLL